MATTSGMSRREMLRQQQQREERAKRNRRTLGAGAAAVALVVVAIVAVVVVQNIGDGAEVNTAQQTPPNAVDGGGIVLTSHGTEPADDAPHVVIYEDYQCPACASSEEAFGPATLELVDQGAITVEVRTAYFLDDMVGNDSSERAALAAAAADEVGKYREFRSIVHENQPSDGAGYTDQQLRVDFPTMAGITGDDLTRFQELYDSSAFQEFVEATDETLADEGITGTPTHMVGETKLEFANEQGEILIQPTPEDLLRAITEANS